MIHFLQNNKFTQCNNSYETSQWDIDRFIAKDYDYAFLYVDYIRLPFIYESLDPEKDVLILNSVRNGSLKHFTYNDKINCKYQYHVLYPNPDYIKQKYSNVTLSRLGYMPVTASGDEMLNITPTVNAWFRVHNKFNDICKCNPKRLLYYGSVNKTKDRQNNLQYVRDKGFEIVKVHIAPNHDILADLLVENDCIGVLGIDGGSEYSKAGTWREHECYLARVPFLRLTKSKVFVESIDTFNNMYISVQEQNDWDSVYSQFINDLKSGNMESVINHNSALSYKLNHNYVYYQCLEALYCKLGKTHEEFIKEIK